jgi:diacylglycerol kinase family enzyme
MLPGVEPRLAVDGDDGRLDVILVRGANPVDAAFAGSEALRQESPGESAGGRAYRASGRRVRVETSPAQVVEADGSVVGRTPLEVAILPAALTVIVPDRGPPARGTETPSDRRVRPTRPRFGT